MKSYIIEVVGIRGDTEGTFTYVVEAESEDAAVVKASTMQSVMFLDHVSSVKAI